MGFFKDFKDDLSQAVNELLPEDVLEEKTEGNTSLEKDLSEDNVDKELLEALLTSEAVDGEADKSLLEEVEASKEADSQDEAEDTEEIEEAKEELKEAEDTETDGTGNTDEVTVIAKSTILTGNLRTDGSLEVIGTIKGDVDCKGKLSVIGNVTGNCSAAEVYIGAKRFEGSVSSDGNVRIGLGTVIIGDILGTAGYIAGAVKGDIDISGPIVIDSSAVIKGNIKAASIQVNNGAVIEGFCSLSYASVNIDNIFE